MPKLSIDGTEIEVVEGTTVLRACEQAGVEIPRFCFHERLSIAGNCRMCLVEQVGVPKPLASCAMPVTDGMQILTRSERVQAAREGVMEFLLVNHPLDCPICDQGGECDLQDQALYYGRVRSRYREAKRAVTDKDFGPLVKTVMTRCIHCTRCVRFMDEVAGVPELGTMGRGEDMEIVAALDGCLHSELSGNIVDLCPVGALTSKPYAFAARPWELSHTESVDVLDAAGSAIRIDSRDGRVLRVLPRVNEEINEEWIGDRARYAVDGLVVRRLDRPWLRADGAFRPVTWEAALAAVATALQAAAPERTAALMGDLAGLEGMTALADLMRARGVDSVDCRQDGGAFGPGEPASWRFNARIAGIDRADAVLLIGTNPRREAPVINARFRKRWRAAGIPIARVGPVTDLTYPVTELGAEPVVLAELAQGSHPFAEVLGQARHPLIVVGSGALARPDGAVVLGLARQLADTVGAAGAAWNGFSVLQRSAARAGGLELGLVPADGGLDASGMQAAAREGRLDFLYLLGADEIDPEAFRDTFTVYQGHHADRGARHADVLLPGAAYTEQEATYVNTEGRPQQARPAHPPPGDARPDWKIFVALARELGSPLPYESLDGLRSRMEAAVPHLADIDQLPPALPLAPFGDPDGALDAAPFEEMVPDYYRTCPISRASATMAACARAVADA